jgi:hypothetical protein
MALKKDGLATILLGLFMHATYSFTGNKKPGGVNPIRTTCPFKEWQETYFELTNELILSASFSISA